jgi:hypothetical protein
LKKLITILFLTILFFSQVGYYFIYRFQQHLLKEEMEAQLFANIPENDLEVFDLDENKSSINWEEEGKEFSLNGELYDVAKIKKVNGKILLYCLNDKKEKQLLQHFTKAVKNDSNNSKSGKHSIKFQFSDFTVTSIEKANNLSILLVKKTIVFNAPLLTSVREIKAPPPKV